MLNDEYLKEMHGKNGFKPYVFSLLYPPNQKPKIYEKNIEYEFIIRSVNEIGYFNMSKEEANHFFQIISKRYERGSTILTSNLVFSKWTTIFANDKVVTTAILDRVLHHSHIINIQGDSYRLKEKQESGFIGSDIFNTKEDLEKNSDGN